MADATNIEWCDSTFNPWIGCAKVSPGCDHCYAERSTPARTLAVVWGPNAERHRTSASNWKLPERWEREHEAFFAQHGRRRRVFCASLADVFDNAVPPAWRAELFAVIAGTPHLDWLLLTKRIGNVNAMIEAPGMQKCGLPENVWLGISVVNQVEADRDIPKLLAVRARVRFLSMEPLLGPVDLRMGGASTPEYAPHRPLPFVDWVIVGGESGPDARAMHPDWVTSLRNQCASAGVPFLFKQWGEWLGAMQDGDPGPALQEVNASDGSVRVGKKAAGRLLDGVRHDGYPEPRS